MSLKQIGVTLEDILLERINKRVKALGLGNRSEYFRSLAVRDIENAKIFVELVERER